MQYLFSSKSRHRIIHNAFAWAALAFYLFAAVVLPAVHQHSCSHNHEQQCCAEVPASAVDEFAQDDDCSICDVIHSTVPIFQFSEPLIQPTENSSSLLPSVLSVPVAKATSLPPCRAPPLV